MLAERPHNKYVGAIFIRDDLKVENVYERVHETGTEIITIVMHGVVVHSVYNTSNDQLEHPVDMGCGCGVLGNVVGFDIGDDALQCCCYLP